MSDRQSEAAVRDGATRGGSVPAPEDRHQQSILAIRRAGVWARALLDDSVVQSVPEPGDLPAARVISPPLPVDRYAFLVHRGVISSSDLARARTVQERAGGSLLTILTSFETVNATAIAGALARQYGLRFVNLDGLTPEPRLVARLDAATAIRHGFVPVGESALGTVVAVTDPTDRQLRSIVTVAIGGPFELVVATAADITDTFSRLWGAESSHRATAFLREASPADSASRVLTREQQLFAAAVIVMTAVALAIATLPTLIALNAIGSVFYLLTAVYRLRLIQLATDPDLGPPGAPLLNSALSRSDAELPIYTILVPLYREAAVLDRLVASLSRLDYPGHKLDVLLICEEDDEETIAAIRGLQLGTRFRIIVVPDSRPKTKPKACNYALDFARGDMAVIYDAEDDPAPDQLRRVLATLAAATDDVACVQARLNYANAEQNMLTHWFTAEYMMWFDLILPGLERIDAPIPLGGTSNHFRMEVLRELGGWDPFNVTEDADLGIRLYKRGYRTLNIDSTTLEEANSQLMNWIRQRSRWMKGHIQTWLVHNRHPIQTRRELGWRGWIGFQLTIGANSVAALVNPIYWILLALWFFTRFGVLRQILPVPIYYLASINLLVWNFLFVYASAVGVARRGATYLVRYALVFPFYWVLISIATWKGALQLITKPFYWEKTVHGLDGSSNA